MSMLSIEKWKRWLEKPLFIDKYISFDIESTGLDIAKDKIHLFSYDLNGKKGVVHIRKDLKTCKPIPREVKRALEDDKHTVIIHSSQFDAPFFRLVTGIHIRKIWDTQITEQVLLAGDYSVSAFNDTNLANTLFRRLGVKLSKEVRESFINYTGPITKKQDQYALGDIKLLRRLAQRQLEESRRLNLEQCVKLENMTCEVTAELRYNGIGFDEQLWFDIADAVENEYNLRISKLPKKVSNWNSPAQVKAYFAKYHDIEIETFKKMPVVVGNKVYDAFNHARELYKAATSYGFKFCIRNKRTANSNATYTVDPDGRIRCTYTQIVETGRYSTSNPNLQNIPAFPVRGFAHRWAFVPARGCVFCVGDFTGQELGLIAAESKEPKWIKAMLAGHDLHAVLAADMFPEWDSIGAKGCTFPFKCKCPEHQKRRRPIKDLNFGLAYGKGAEAYARDTKMPLKEAYQIIRRYKKKNPRVTAYLKRNGEHGVRHGFIRTPPPFERLRKFKGEEYRLRNQGKNTPIQGGGADMMKLAMCMIYDHIYTNRLESKIKMVLTVHDELILEVKKGSESKAMKMMKYYMEEAAMFITKDRLVTTDPETMIQWELKDKPRAQIEKEFRLELRKERLKTAA